jgi:uncharacterized protein YggU (UPF0235/DUF167 family)
MPGSRQQEIREQADGSLMVRLRSSPVDGAANQELIDLLHRKFRVPKSAIRIKLGMLSRNKLIEIG